MFNISVCSIFFPFNKIIITTFIHETNVKTDYKMLRAFVHKASHVCYPTPLIDPPQLRTLYKVKWMETKIVECHTKGLFW